jgi:phage shock protein A
MELVQDLLRPFVEDLGRVREELGAERVRRERAEQDRDELRSQLEALQATPATREALETVSETSEGTDTPTGQGDRETGVQRRSSWWRRFFGFE